ncbi:xanthine dehydrogenase family protein subunit M [Nonomuraea antimicrobica]|uniref:Xanthine dehydrogenase family protein subunit M n=1 Tax=Nonomuraea antimicrobica TaxID=561173 RepID=A0ABP7CZR2_9ACTN
MKAFRYARATSEADAVTLASGDPTAVYIAGGTETLNLIRDGLLAPDLVVDVNAVPADGIAWGRDAVRIGALTSMAAVAGDSRIRTRLPVLSEALSASASAQVRNMASVGGNLMQRTRCWYFRDAALPCNTRIPDSGCPATEGENRWHAILGGSEHCIKVHPSDLAVALTALDATILIREAQGERRIPIGDFYRLPGSTPHVETALPHGGLIVGVEIPSGLTRSRSGYRKVRDRASFEFALVSVAVSLDMDGDAVREARIALGGVAPRPWRAVEAEAAVRGRRLDPDVLEAAAEAAVRGAVPREHNGFKVELVRRTLADVLARIGGKR